MGKGTVGHLTKFACAAGAALVIIAMAGCGGSSTTSSTGSNAAKISHAAAIDTTAAQVHRLLTRNLALHSYAGVTDVFVAGAALCYIDTIDAGPDAGSYSDDPDTLMSPNGQIAVKVDEFQGTPAAPCLEAADAALGWH